MSRAINGHIIIHAQGFEVPNQVKPNITKRQALEELARRKARSNLLAFTLLTLPNYQDNWHHKLISDHLQAVEAGQIKRLMIFIPPRGGKSELASIRFPAWYFGRNPQKQLIATSYSVDLASDFGRKVRDLVADPLFREIFPQSGISDKSTSSTRFHTAKGGAYSAAGVGGPITGRGADCLLIDDPIKNREEAYSKTVRDSVWEWYRTTAYTRLQPNGSIVLIMTRWHTDDLAGRILKETGADWDVVSLPAIAERDDEFRKQGEALWPEFYPIDVLQTIKTEIGSTAFNSLYQQRPSLEEGSIIKRHWFKYYDVLPQDTVMIQSWDMAFKDTDSGSYVVGQVWAMKGACYYLVDQARKRMDFVETLQAVRALTNRWPEATLKLVEDKANGPAVISALKKEIHGLVEVGPDGSKEARLSAVSPLIESGNVYIPHPDTCRWVDEFIEEVCSFPAAPHDDQVDAMSQALRHLMSRSHNASIESASLFGEERVSYAGW